MLPAAAPNGGSYIYVSFCALSLALGALIYSLMSNLTQLNRLNTSNEPKEASAWHGCVQLLAASHSAWRGCMLILAASHSAAFAHGA